MLARGQRCVLEPFRARADEGSRAHVFAFKELAVMPDDVECGLLTCSSVLSPVLH